MNSRGIESTAALLVRVRDGDAAARDALALRYREMLRKWAHGRLPAAARDLVDTEDIVQVTLMRAFVRLDQFEPRREGAFLAYVRRIILNQIRDQAKRARRRPLHHELEEDTMEDGARSPLDEIIGRENVQRYEHALGQLTDRQREAVILRIELGLRYREVAEALGAASVNAARLIVARALVRLAAVLREEPSASVTVEEE